MGCMQLRSSEKGIIKSNIVNNNDKEKEPKINEDNNKLNNYSNHKPTLSKSSFTNQERQNSSPNVVPVKVSINAAKSPKHILDFNDEHKIPLPNSSNNLPTGINKITASSNFQPRGSINKIQKFEVTEVDKIIIKQSLSNHFLFKDKTSQIINILIDNLQLIKLGPDTILFKRGDKGNTFYIVKEGRLLLETEYGTKELHPNDTFGELALIESKKRTASVKSMEACSLFALNGKLFRDIVNKINENDMKNRLSFLKLVPLFCNLNNVGINSLAGSMIKCEFDIGQTILSEGDIGQSFYIIKSGKVKVFTGDHLIRELGPRDFFGESAILFEKNRSSTIYASEKTTCFQISQSVLTESLGQNYKNVIITSIAKEALRQSKYMKSFENISYFNILFEHCIIRSYEDKDLVLKKGALKEKKLFVLLSGNFIDSSTFGVVASRGQLFGDIILKNNEIIKNDIYAQGECQVLEFDWEEVSSKLGLNVERRKILSLLSRIGHMRRIQIFHFTSEHRLLEICKMMKKEKFEMGSVIFKEGEMGNKLYLIKKGKVKASKENKFIRELSEGNCFGEIALLINEPRTATVIAETKVSTYTLTKDHFNSFIDQHMLNYLAKKISLQDTFNQPLEGLCFCKSLGKGKFGTVSLVHNFKNFYAMKAVSRKAADNQKILIKYFIQERNILLKLEHPFIMKLVRTYKTDNHIFFMLEYIQGKVLSKYLNARNKNSLYNIKMLKFYIACLLIILSYLNSKQICHRDLKPDNIVIDEKGYLKLIDFGTSIELKDFTNTITGTPHYIAPEILTGKGYGLSCDYWSVGIIAHEIYYGMYPFGKNAKDPIDVYREIVKKELHLPSGDSFAVDLIKALLTKKVSERVTSLEKAKSLDIFSDFKWNEMIDMKMEAPFIPRLSPPKEFNNYLLKYLTYVKNEIEKNNKKESSLLSSYNDSDDKDVKYDPNWADVF